MAQEIEIKTMSPFLDSEKSVADFPPSQSNEKLAVSAP